MLDSSVLLPVVQNGLVERNVFILRDVISFSHPDGLQTVEMLPLVAHLLDLFCLLLFFASSSSNSSTFGFLDGGSPPDGGSFPSPKAQTKSG